MGHLSKLWDDQADKKIIKTLRCHPMAVIIDKKLVTTTFLSGHVFETILKVEFFKNLMGWANENSHYIPGIIELDCAVMAWESQFIFYQGLKLVHCWSHEPTRTKQKSNIGLERRERWTRTKFRGSSSVTRLSRTDVFTEIESQGQEMEGLNHVGGYRLVT